jgi:hypothetical protein
MASIKKIKTEFLRIKNLGFVPNEKSENNDSAIGATFEKYLGVKENNSKDADFQGWEIKTKKQFSKTATSLFSLKPSYPKGGDRYMLNKFGEPDEDFPNATNLNTSIYCNKEKQYYKNLFYKLKLGDDRITLIVKDKNKKLFDNNVYWLFSDIRKSAKKLRNTAIVNAEKKEVDGKSQFKYIEIKALINCNFDRLIEYFTSGLFYYEHRWSPDKTGDRKGKNHNHGGGFRIKKSSDFEKLFEHVIEL